MHTFLHVLTSSLELGLHFSVRTVGSEGGKTGEAPERREKEVKKKKGRQNGALHHAVSKDEPLPLQTFESPLRHFSLSGFPDEVDPVAPLGL
ncbi:hypothetical protein JOQ06_026824, partial [Pogonophryne albipinna]